MNTLVPLTALIQLLDAAVDFMEGRWPLVPGVLILSVLFLLAGSAASPAIPSGERKHGAKSNNGLWSPRAAFGFSTSGRPSLSAAIPATTRPP